MVFLGCVGDICSGNGDTDLLHVQKTEKYWRIIGEEARGHSKPLASLKRGLLEWQKRMLWSLYQSRDLM